MINSTLKVLGKFYSAKGKTVLEAISNLSPEIARGVGILTLEKGDIKKEKILLPRTVNGLYGKTSRLNKETALKNVSQLFDTTLFE